MALKSKGTAKAVVSAKPKVKAMPMKVKGEKLTAAAAKPMAKAAVKATAMVAAKPTAKVSAKPQAQAKPQPQMAAPVAAKSPPAAKAQVKPGRVQPAITMAKEALKATTVKAIKAEKAEKPARSRKISVSASATEAASALAQKWISLFKKAEQIEAKPYNMKAVFEEKTAIVHKVLGWGYILANRNDRLEVLFKDGIKYLISNYKP